MQIDTLLNDFASKGWGAHPFERLVQLVTESPIDAASFAEAALLKFPEGGTFFDLTLSFISKQAFEHLILVALRRLSATSAKHAAESVIEYASLQFPDLLHRHLSEIFALRPNRGTYYENYPWRDSGTQDHANLMAIIDSNPSDKDRLKSWLCLLESRFGPALADAASQASKVPLVHPAHLYFHQIGYDSPAIPLYDPTPRHLIFQPSYFTDKRPVWNDRSFHPTWHLVGDYLQCRFGGYASGTCGHCGGQLHHLITLPGTLSPSLASLTLATCLSCLGWEKPFLAYKHENTGLPQPINSGQVSPKFPAVALKETNVRVTLTPPRWRWQEWGASNSRENLCRVGGHPSWIQSAEYPSCPSCGTTMRFIVQFDSDLPTEDGGEWLWGSGGICYGFWCQQCQVSGFLWQCT